MTTIRILVIEDDDFVVNDIRQMLRSCGYPQPRITPSGEEGLRLIESYQPDLVLMGLVLKGNLDGIEVYEKIQSDTNIPVIFLTDHDEEDILKYIGISETYGYLFKPFIERDLYAKILLALNLHSTEKQLQDSEERFQLISKSFPGVIYLRKNRDSLTPIYLGDSIRDLTGFDSSDYTDGTIDFVDMIHPDDLEGYLYAVKTALENRNTYRYQYRIRHKAGGWCDVEDIGNGTFGEDKLLYVEGFIHQHIEGKPVQIPAEPVMNPQSPLLTEHAIETQDIDFQQVLEYCTDAVMVHTNGEIVYSNTAGAQLLGTPLNELLGEQILNFVHPAYKSVFTGQKFSESQAGESLKFHREQFIQADGSVIDVELAGTPVNYRGEPSVQLILKDVTQELKNAEVLQYNQERNSLIQKVANVGYWDWDIREDFFQWSPVVYNFLNVSPDNFEHNFQGFLKCVSKTDREEIENAHRNSLQLGKEFDTRFKTITKAGDTRHFSMKGDLIRDWQGKVVRITGLIQDVTDQKRFEQKIRSINEDVGHGPTTQSSAVGLKNALRQNKEMFDHGGVILIMAEKMEHQDPATTYVSPNITQLGSFGQSLLSGKMDFQDLIHKDDRSRVDSFVKDRLALGRDYWEQEYRIVLDEDEIRWVNESTQVQHHDDRPELKTFFIFISDITNVKKIRVELEEKQAQLIHSGRLASLGELAAGVAHELNQPLQIIMAQAEVLKIMMRKSNALDNDVKEDLDTIIEEVSRASEIISHMRDFSRLDYKVSGEVDLTESIEKSLMFFRKQFKNHNIALTINYGDNLPGVELNPQRFEQVVVNFMSNARHAVNSRAGTEEASYQKEISINLYESRDQNALIFEVKDNGTGMTEEEKNHCTDPFYTTKEVSEGTGLGLSIVNGIVKEFNGHLEIESKLDIGTTMRVVIPLKLKR